MGNQMTYSGIVAKIRAMQRNLLTEEDFEKIAGFHNVPEVIEYLKEKPAYEKYIRQMDKVLYHRKYVEKVLYESLYDDYTRLFRFAGMEQKKYLKMYWKRYEVNLINYCLRIVFNHYDVPFDLEDNRHFFDNYSKIRMDKLITSRNIDELVDNLKGTEYYKPLEKLRSSGAATLFDYDLALELYYFSTLWKKERKLLKGEEKGIFMRDFGTKMDLLNIQWIYRAKKYYHMLPPDIYSLVIPYHYRVKVDEFKAMAEAPTVEEFLKKRKETYYTRRYGLADDKTWEQKQKDILHALYVRDRRKDPYSPASINTYLFLKEEEINKLTTVLECIRYGLPKGETLNYIGGVKQ